MLKYTPLQYALNLLKIRDRAEDELKKKMKTKGFVDADVTEAILLLKKKGLIDDERLVKNMIDCQKLRQQSGKLKLQNRMYRLGLKKEIIENNIGELVFDDELAKAKELAGKWLEKNAQKDKKYQRLGRFLVGRGFEMGVVMKILKRLEILR